MAQAELERLAKQLEEELKASSEEYRAIVSDFMPHKITVSEKQIKAESRKQLRLMLGLPPSASLSSIPKGEVLEKIIKNEAPKMCRILYDIFDPKKFEGNRRVYLASEREGSSLQTLLLDSLRKKALQEMYLDTFAEQSKEHKKD